MSIARTGTGGGTMAVLERAYREVKAARRRRRGPIERRVVIPNAQASPERQAAYTFRLDMAKEVR